MEGIEKKMWLRVMDSDALRAIGVGLPQSEIAHGAEKHQNAERLKPARSPYWQYVRESEVKVLGEHRVTRGSNIYKLLKAI